MKIVSRITAAFLLTASALVSAEEMAAASTPLSALLLEAEQHNPQILAAAAGYQATAAMPPSAGALPDTHVQLQLFSVGSPKPFAGYTNSNFSYVGIGASQEIPFPGKRRLRAETAQFDADAANVGIDVIRRTVLQQVQIAYYQLAYLQQAITVLQQDDRLLEDIEQATEAHYRIGQGNQQDVLKAQLQRTKLLQEITDHHRKESQWQARIKQLLSRPQSSVDIHTDALRERTLPYTTKQLQTLTQQQNPSIRFNAEQLKAAESQVELAQKEFRPDFNVQYMYENTGPDYRDYYMVTFGINLPNRKRRRAELAAVEWKKRQAQKELEAQKQQQSADLQQGYVAAQNAAEQIKIYKEGLIPQAHAAFQAALASYAANRQDFQTVLSSFLDVLQLQLEYQQQLADHESALAKLESISGVTLP